MSFWGNVKQKILEQNTTQTWVAGHVPTTPDKFSRWIQRDVMPNADQAVAIAKCLGTTVEELVDGESGRVYALNWAERNGAKWRPPERIAALIEDLNAMNDKDLETMLVTASVIKAKRLSETAASAS